jgi:hypothetical protein
LGSLSHHGIEKAWERGADAVVVAEAPSGLILFSSAGEARVVRRRLAAVAEEEAGQRLHPYGRPYASSECRCP